MQQKLDGPLSHSIDHLWRVGKLRFKSLARLPQIGWKFTIQKSRSPRSHAKEFPNLDAGTRYQSKCFKNLDLRHQLIKIAFESVKERTKSTIYAKLNWTCYLHPTLAIKS
jgi:hypothetical protein